MFIWNFFFPASVDTRNLSSLQKDPKIEDTADLRKRGLASIDRIYSALDYAKNPEFHFAVHAWKYRHRSVLTTEFVALMMSAHPDLQNAVLCPVPLHWTRRLTRGFNQAELLCSRLKVDCGGVSTSSLLRRTRSTGHQAHRGRQERLHALNNAFVCIGTPPNHVLLVDDLSTTGATLDACAFALKYAGAEKVEGWVIARG